MKHNQSSKQNQRIERISETTLVIGTDIAKNNHVARAFTYRGIELGKRCLFQNDEQGLLNLLAWAEALKQEHGMSDVILGVEPTGHYWFPLFHFLKGHGIQVVLVNPHHVKKSKELDDNSPTKNDIKDAKVVAKLIIDGQRAAASGRHLCRSAGADEPARASERGFEPRERKNPQLAGSLLSRIYASV
jgi:transposase